MEDIGCCETNSATQTYKMKFFLAVFTLTIIAVVLARPEEKYTTKYDNVDLQEILKNDRLMQNYINCVLDKGACSADGAELKKSLPDALKTDCSKCSDKQKEGSKVIIRHIYKKRPEDWKELEAKYDSDGSYVKKYEAELATL